MIIPHPHPRRPLHLLVLIAALAAAPVHVARAAPPPASAAVRQEANKHFQRGVTLFNEADYRAALVEFKRAYELSPHPATLYNIGQTYFQLQNYAAALTSFEKFLAQSAPDAPHRSEVETSADTLRARVGKVSVTTNVPADIAVDDDVLGRTPLEQPVLVSIGRRKITAMAHGALPVTQYVEVAAGETVQVSLTIIAENKTPAPVADHPSAPAGGDAPPSSNTLPIVLWLGAGALAAGAVVTGFVALNADSSLSNATGEAGTSRQRLDDLHDRRRTFAAVTDVLAVTAIVTGGAALYFTLTRRSTGAARVGLAPRGAVIEGSF